MNSNNKITIGSEDSTIGSSDPTIRSLTNEPKISISFQNPVHHSPCAIAHTFGYEPLISLKIDLDLILRLLV